MTLLAAKILLAPLCVVAVSLAGRRWGMAVAGLLGGLPVVAGPILLVETLLHGRDFGADAAAGTLLALAALAAFVVVYGRVAAGGGPVASVLCGWTAFLIGVAVMYPIEPSLALSAAFVGALGPRLSGLLAPFPIVALALPDLTTAAAFGLATAAALGVQATTFYLRGSRPVSAR